jgi:hypothetical protein
MNVSADKYESDKRHRADTFFLLGQLFKDIVSWLTRIFTVTKEERSNAGVYLRGEKHD